MRKTIILLCLLLCAVGARADGEAVLTFSSFEGGGAEYRIEIEDPSVVSCEYARQYDSDEEPLPPGSGYTETYAFRGLKPGTTTVTVYSSSPIMAGSRAVYLMTVDEALDVTVQILAAEDRDALVPPTPTLVIRAGGKIFYAALEDNSSAEAFVERLNPGAIEVEMRDYGGFEKVGRLPWSLPGNDGEITTAPGDVILYQGNRIAIYYDENTWDFTRLARIGNVSGAELLEALGDGDATVEFWLEWSE